MSNAGPLSGISVVELTIHRAGPFCGAMLADLGADVVKIERPDVGDPTRAQGPGPSGRSGYFMANNRNKRSVTLDLKTDSGRDAARKLLAGADVFVENFGYGVAERLGLGYETLRERNPDLVYASIKGYGTTGPYRDRPGLDLILQAEGGIMSVTGPEDGEPVKVGQAIGDLTTGMFATIGVLARLCQRRDADEGFDGRFDVGLFDSIVTLMNEYHTWYSIDGRVPGPQGRSHQTMVPYQLFETADGYLATGVPSDERWSAFVELLDVEELAKYQKNDQRRAHREEIVGALQDRFVTAPTDHWVERLTEHGFPAGPLNDVEDVIEHEQTRARNLIFEHTDDVGDEYYLPGHPIHFPDYDPELRYPAPRLGEHTEEVMLEMTDQTEIDDWSEGGAFGGRAPPN